MTACVGNGIEGLRQKRPCCALEVHAGLIGGVKRHHVRTAVAAQVRYGDGLREGRGWVRDRGVERSAWALNEHVKARFRRAHSHAEDDVISPVTSQVRDPKASIYERVARIVRRWAEPALHGSRIDADGLGEKEDHVFSAIPRHICDSEDGTAVEEWRHREVQTSEVLCEKRPRLERGRP